MQFSPRESGGEKGLKFLNIFRFKLEIKFVKKVEMEEADKVRFIREGLIEQDRLKLNTAQGK